MKDRKNQYSIGEVAALLNISPQTLRFYDKSGVVVPDFIDQKTGYRYYSYDQISYISRVRYLQQLDSVWRRSEMHWRPMTSDNSALFCSGVARTCGPRRST